jgi:hypothetical protein
VKSGFGVKREMELKNNGENCILRNFMLAAPNQAISNAWSI